MHLTITLLAAATVAGCADESQTLIAYPTPAHYETRVYTSAQPTHVDEAPRVAAADESTRRVLILQTRKLDRPAEVVGIVDAHEEGGREDVALNELRRKAAAIGAHAVVGVEFHHAESAGEPLHLSGLAVRYTSGGTR